jgi:hypothetical protein
LDLEALVVRLAEENREWGYRKNSERLVQSRTPDCPKYDRGDSGATRHRAGAGAKPEALGVDRGCGFHRCGSVDSARAAAVPSAFFIDLATRRVEIAGIASAANGLWMSQIGRNHKDAIDGILNGKRYPAVAWAGALAACGLRYQILVLH